MKRLLTVLIAAAVVLTAYPAFAEILGSPHDFTGQAGAGTYVYGTCDTCHVPHAAKERKRLWNNVTGITISGTPWGSTTKGVGLLCASCHYGGAFTVQNVGGKAADNMANFAYAATSHGDSLTVLEGTAAGDLNDTNGGPLNNNLPYTQNASNTIECTSCHNPHQDGNSTNGGDPQANTTNGVGLRPFLRADTAMISDFCAKCHLNRETTTLSVTDYDNGGTATGAEPAGYPDFTRNHPVNQQYGDSATNGVGWFKSLASGGPVTTVVFGTNNNALVGWSLGGKMQNSNGSVPAAGGALYSDSVGSTADAAGVQGGTGQGSQIIGCETCHSIHMPEGLNSATPHAGSDTGTSYASLWLLAVGNSGQAGDYRSDLCETCHGQAISTSPTTWDTRAGGVAASNTFGYDHPIDGPIDSTAISSFITSWSNKNSGASFGNGSPRIRAERVPGGVSTTWPAGDMAGTSGQQMIICTSCHSAHHAGTRLRRMNGDTTHWCKSCHPGVSPLGHHSNSSNDALSVLQCADCHSDVPTLTNGTYSVPTGGTAGGGWAHNGFVYYNLGGDNMGQTPLATNTNGATASEPATQLSGGFGCSECHAAAKQQITNPIDANGVPGNSGPFVPPVNRLGDVTNQYQVSHYVGQFDTNGKGVAINVKTGSWQLPSTQMLLNHKGERRDYSKFGNATGVGPQSSGVYLLTCESCHSILGNIGRVATLASISSGWENNLLLQDYEDDSYYGNGAASNPTLTVGDSKTTSGNGITWATQTNALSVGSGFCIACHNQGGTTYNQGAGNGPVPDYAVQDPAVAPPNMHPMTGWSITRAQDAGRTTGNGYFLTTDQSQGSYANNPQLATGGTYGPSGTAPATTTGGSAGLGTGEGAVSYPVTPGSLHTANGDPLSYAGAMDCDSCHRPHNAPSGAWLPVGNIKTRTLSSSAIGNGAVETTTTSPVGVPVILEYANTAQGTASDNTGTLCEQCHSY